MSISSTTESVSTPFDSPPAEERFMWIGSNTSIQAVPWGVILITCKSAW
jgi:hypothetical protein